MKSTVITDYIDLLNKPFIRYQRLAFSEGTLDVVTNGFPFQSLPFLNGGSLKPLSKKQQGRYYHFTFLV